MGNVIYLSSRRALNTAGQQPARRSWIHRCTVGHSLSRHRIPVRITLDIAERCPHCERHWTDEPGGAA